MTPADTTDTTATPRKRRRIVRRKTVTVRRLAVEDDTPREPELTAKEWLAVVLSDTSRTFKSGAELAALFPKREPSDVEKRVHERIQRGRALEKRRALAEGLPWD